MHTWSAENVSLAYASIDEYHAMAGHGTWYRIASQGEANETRGAGSPYHGCDLTVGGDFSFRDLRNHLENPLVKISCQSLCPSISENWRYSAGGLSWSYVRVPASSCTVPYGIHSTGQPCKMETCGGRQTAVTGFSGSWLAILADAHRSWLHRTRMQMIAAGTERDLT